jgi:hypothetical protein
MADEPKRPAGPRALSQLQKFLTGAGYEFLANQTGKLKGLTGGKGLQWHWSAGASQDNRYLIFYAYSPVYVTPDKRAAAAEYLTRANWGLYFGTFEMDWSDGQVCFRTSVPLAPAEATVQALERLVWSNGALMERYLPGLLAVALSDASPEVALLEAERDLRPPAEIPPAEGPPAQPEASNGQTMWPRRFSASDN